ncbi:SDR family NAD(P)-dependent oxidoreductase [Streptomyces sp. N50]|uniref:SDR family NAD(P)-dependent oxidoreductase n=1 Tax=Streptomyces sp. N50 TaxID=3081765 RepID=UPI002961EE95|nr:SDR family NAD(P)-dependent oxidoreductase [Streptomyces sp. N50]WOX15125.1 SDR family NAD(P)-dependent oxidoreductase [Streptomyces sp. N50]
MSEKPLGGAVALVTGASSGIGAATARRLAQEGAAVALVARRRDRLDRLAQDITRLGGRADVVEADISDPEQAYQAVQVTLGRLERLDILVNNAGIMLLGTALHATVEEWDRMVSLNVTALLHVTHAAVPYLIDAATTSPRQVADIVDVGSTAGRVARPGSSVYNLTKSGLNGFTEALRQELLVERVRVAVVEPGTVRTELVDHLGEATREAALRQVSGIEPLRAEDVADAIAYIVTRERRVAVNEMLIRAGDQTW